jgi:hypothetical protein
MKTAPPLLLIPLLLVVLVVALVIISQAEPSRLRTNIPIFPIPSSLGSPLPSSEPELGACYRSDNRLCTKTTHEDCSDGDENLVWRWYDGQECIPSNVCNPDALAQRDIGFAFSIEDTEEDCEAVWDKLEGECLDSLTDEVVDECGQVAQAYPGLCGVIAHAGPYYDHRVSPTLFGGGSPGPEPSGAPAIVFCQVYCELLYQCGINPS